MDADNSIRVQKWMLNIVLESKMDADNMVLRSKNGC